MTDVAIPRTGDGQSTGGSPYSCHVTVNRGDASTAAARDLAAGLRDLRGRTQLTTRALGEKAGTSAANISNWERGDRLPNEERLGKLLEALGASDNERERLIGLRRRAQGPGELVTDTPDPGQRLFSFVESEQVAVGMTAAAPLLLPGLLQTADYARATLQGQRDVETRVALRMGRREILTKTREPADYVAYIDTEVLVRPVVQGRAMADQLRHLLRMAELPNVTIRLVPSTTPGYTPMLAGAFILLKFASAAPIVHLEHYGASVSIWDAEEVRGFQDAAEAINNIAMTPEQSSEAIASIVNGLE